MRAAPLASVPQFDAAGTAYLSARCSGTVAIAPAHSRRFRRTIVTRGAAKSFTLALSGAGKGLAAWVAGACTYSETTPPQSGAVLVSLLRANRFDTPFALTAAPTESAFAAATPPGVTVSWYVRAANQTEEPFSTQIGADGVPGTVQDDPAALPLSADSNGDILFSPLSPTAPPFVRPAGGGADQPGPAPWGQGKSAVNPAARAIALIWSPNMTQLDLSIWHP